MAKSLVVDEEGSSRAVLGAAGKLHSSQVDDPDDVAAALDSGCYIHVVIKIFWLERLANFCIKDNTT